MRRRSFIATTASLLAAPAIAQDTRKSTLRFVPQANLTVLDPVWTTATVTNGHGNYVFDTLYGCDARMRPQPHCIRPAAPQSHIQELQDLHIFIYTG